MRTEVTKGTYIGIDPGAKGAVALLHGENLYLWPAPMVLERRGKSRKLTTDLPRLAMLVRVLAELRPAVAIERVWGVRGQGASSGAALGHARCAFEMAFHMAEIVPQLVSPQRWKADLGLYNQEKRAALDKASKLFPAFADQFRPVRGERDTEACIGRADAALIAWHLAKC